MKQLEGNRGRNNETLISVTPWPTCGICQGSKRVITSGDESGATYIIQSMVKTRDGAGGARSRLHTLTVKGLTRLFPLELPCYLTVPLKGDSEVKKVWDVYLLSTFFVSLQANMTPDSSVRQRQIPSDAAVEE
ncbi:hypothetical protein J6590_050141 [Homalodisca vitripennis]|nr:hypothetical protein J6590_050141 [Homalodisca vitripennis]